MKKTALVLRNVGHGVNDISWFILPSLLPVILVQFNMKYETAGGLLTAFLGVIAVFSYILGKLSDRFSRQIILGAGFLVASIFLICSSFMGRLSLFVSCVVVAGIGVSSYHPAIYAYIDETTASRQGKEYGMFEFWGSTAIFFMFILHGLLLKNLSWRNIILLTSIPGIVVGSLYFTFMRMPQFTGVHRNKIIVNVPDARDTPLILFIVFLLVVTFRFFGIMAVVNFTPTYLVREVGLQNNFASFATGIYFLGGLVFTPFVGRLCDTRSPFLVLLIVTGIAFPLIFLISLSHPLWILPLYLFLLGGAYYGAGPAMNMIIAQMSSKMGKGEAFGYFMAIIAVTFSFSPLIFGMYADRIGLSLTMRFFSFPLLMSAILLALLFFLIRSGDQDPWANAHLRT